MVECDNAARPVAEVVPVKCKGKREPNDPKLRKDKLQK